MIFNYNLRNYNFRIVLYMLFLSIAGILVLRSASGGDSSVVGKQIMGVALSFTASIIISFIDYHKIFRFNILIYVGCVVLLIAVLIAGHNSHGATRWLNIFGFTVQPSEFLKVGLIIVLSWYAAKNQERINKPSVLGTAVLLVAFPVGLVLAQPNLSTSIVITIPLIFIIYAAGLSYKWIGGVLAVGIPAGGLFLYLAQYGIVPFLHQYQAQRILAKIFHGSAQYADANSQQDKSIMAIGSGQLWGKGLNNVGVGSVKSGNFVAEEQTDFIFAVIGEELGFVGSMVIISVLALLVFECLLTASRAKDMGGRLVCIGIAVLIGFQGFANIAVATGIFPNTGLPLPFISSGISSLLSIFIGMGIVLNIGLQRKSNNN